MRASFHSFDCCLLMGFWRHANVDNVGFLLGQHLGKTRVGFLDPEFTSRIFGKSEVQITYRTNANRTALPEKGWYVTVLGCMATSNCYGYKLVHFALRGVNVLV